MHTPEGPPPHSSDWQSTGKRPTGKQPTGPEWELTEKPLIDQLTTMGWTLGEGDARSSFTQTLLELPLRAALRRINLDDNGDEWLDESRIDQAISALNRPQARTLIEINEELTGHLLVGTEVDGVEGWNGGRRQTVRFIDFDAVDNNDFRIVRGFVLDGPGAPGTDRIIPDLVLFVNGIPLVVIEAKSPDSASPMATAIDQLRRYANQRGDVRANEGNEKLFHTNQFVIAAHGTNARAAGFTAGPEHFMEWKTTEPLTPEQVAAELDLTGPDTTDAANAAKALNGQQMLVAGMLRPSILLDLVRHFTLFMETDTSRVKVVARYQQYRAVHRAIERMATQPTRLQHGEMDQRGGIVWHTQGSGKSLTMVFLVRAMRSHRALTAFKIIVVTDRTQLQDQLSATMALTGESTKTIAKVKELESTLAIPGKGLYFAMIHKYQAKDTENPGGGASDGGVSEEEPAEPAEETESTKAKKEIVPQLDVADDSSDVLVLVDEAHRSQGSQLHANLMGALPNAVRVGFTGTPIIMGDKDRFTSKIFGAFIDSYTIKQSEADGATVPILYEGRTTKAHVRDGNDLDELFPSIIDATPEQLEELKRRYATKNHVLEAEAMIAAKAASMLRHYVDVILPNGFKAQVVAVSRKAAVRYQAALIAARDALVAEIDALPDELRTPEAAEMAESHGAATARLIRALPYRDLIARLDAAAVISGAHNDSGDWKEASKEWTNETKHRTRIREFKKPLPLGANPHPENTSPLAFLVVNSMLLTGFDAPGEQILYLDRHIKEAELLQAIARVNRTAKGKRVGYVIDYYGVAEHLKTALAAYAAEDIEGALSSVRSEVPLLRERHERMRKIFTIHGHDRFDTDEDREECVQLLADESRRREFRGALKDFNRSLETVLPRPEAREFVPDAKSFGVIATLACARYREDDGFDPSLYGGKVRDLIDQYIRVHDIRTKIPPTAITASDFESKVEALSSDRAKASEMEHAMRHHISQNLDQDPEYYGKLSERLDEILSSLDGNWAAMYEAMRDMRTDMAEGRQADDTGLDPNTEAPFYDLLAATVRDGETGDLAPELRDVLVDFTKGVSRDMRAAMRLRGYGDHRGRELRDQMVRALFKVKLEGIGLFPLPDAKKVGPRLVDLAEKKFARR